MIAVTGIFGSGINAIADFLLRSGFNRGSSHPVCESHDGDTHQERGRFENRSVMTINDSILRMAGGSWRKVPSNRQVLDTGFQVRRMIEKFSEIFDGSLIVDQRLCLTTALWEEFSPQLKHIVLCVRHPLTIASILRDTEKMALNDGLQLWYTYIMRCIQGACMVSVSVVDGDALVNNTASVLMDLAEQVGTSCSEIDIARIQNKYCAGLLQQQYRAEQLHGTLPIEVAKLYEMISPDGELHQPFHHSAGCFQP